MLTPLDERVLGSLVKYDEEVEEGAIVDPRKPVGMNSVSEGLQFIFLRFSFFGAFLETPGAAGDAERPCPPDWLVGFRALWKHLSIQRDPADKTACRVFEDGKYIKTFKILECPDQWTEVVCWIWNYGNERAAALEAVDTRRKATNHGVNPAFSLSSQRPKSRSQHMPTFPSPTHPANHVLRRTGLTPHQRIKRSRVKQRGNLLRVMTLADAEEDEQVEGQVSKEVVFEHHDVLRESDANRQRDSKGSLKETTIEGNWRNSRRSMGVKLDEFPRLTTDEPP